MWRWPGWEGKGGRLNLKIEKFANQTKSVPLTRPFGPHSQSGREVLRLTPHPPTPLSSNRSRIHRRAERDAEGVFLRELAFVKVASEGMPDSDHLDAGAQVRPAVFVQSPSSPPPLSTQPPPQNANCNPPPYGEGWGGAAPGTPHHQDCNFHGTTNGGMFASRKTSLCSLLVLHSV